MEILKKSEGIVYTILDVNFFCVVYNVFSILDVNFFCVEILISEVFEQRQVVGATLCNDEDIKLPAKNVCIYELRGRHHTKIPANIYVLISCLMHT